ncbi:MAG TPA: hypothetical protein VJP85_07795 [Candidatus Baltobacteraceae bacterium]|nr:hypothetical protein [Candidatus Baltobacteraceae bacterium]
MAAPRPIASGDTFAYTGNLHQIYAQSAPCPQPTAISDATVTSSVSDAPTTAPDNNPGTASTVSETDAFPTHTSTTSTTQIVQINGGKLLLYSTTSNDGTGNSIQTAYTSAQEIDDLGVGGTWTNDPAAAVKEALSDGSSISRTLKSDGSYVDTQTYPNASTATISVNGAATGKAFDGSGVYSFAGASFAYAAPSGGNITLTITSPGSPSKTRTFPAWFAVPASGKYVTDTFADNGSKPFDAGCSVPNTIGTSGTQVVETYGVLDPVLGYTETRTTTSYDVSGYGPVCVTIADTLNSYYDYAADTTRIDYQSTNGQPNSVNTITETLSMQSATCGSGSPPCAQIRRTANAKPVSARAIAGRIAVIQHYRDVQRAQRIDALRRFALRLRSQGGAR